MEVLGMLGWSSRYSQVMRRTVFKTYIMSSDGDDVMSQNFNSSWVFSDCSTYALACKVVGHPLQGMGIMNSFDQL